MDYNAPLFQNAPEVWNAQTCQKMANRHAKDGLGTPYPFKGYIGSSQRYGVTRYNGGCTRDGKWWQGENHPLHMIHPDYEIIVVPTWGYRIRLRDPRIPT